MSNKCRWENDKFKGCDGANRIFLKGDLFSFSGYVQNGLKEFYSDLKFCPFCGESLEKPFNIEEGMFGHFWDEGDKIGEWGVLRSIDKRTERMYVSSDSYNWTYFTPGLPEDFNKDGTPKKDYESIMRSW